MRAALLLVLLAAGCGTAPDAVRFAVALPRGDHPAVRMAVEEINRNGGIHGAPLEPVGLEWQFDDSTPETALEWAQRHASNPDVVALIGHSDSASALAAASVYQQHRLPHLVTIATHPAITRIGGYTYRLCASDLRQAQVLAHHAVRDLGARDIAVFFANDDYGRGLAGLFHAEAEALGGRIVSSVLHRNRLEDDDRELIGTVLKRLQAEHPPDVFLLDVFLLPRAGRLVAGSVGPLPMARGPAARVLPVGVRVRVGVRA